MPGEVTDLLTNITTQWVQLSNGMIVTPGHLFARPHGGFMSIADVLRLDGQILDAHGQVQTVTGSWIHFSADTAERFETAAVQVLPHHGSTALEPQMVVGWRTYNFTVSDTHTYIAHDVRVHNDSQWQERYEAYLVETMGNPEQLSYEAWKAEYAIQDGPPVGPNGEGSDAPVNGPTDPEDTGDTGDAGDTGSSDDAGDPSAGYNGPSQEYSPGDIDPVTGRVITSVDEYGNITELQHPGYNSPSQEFSPGDVDPVTNFWVGSVNDLGQITSLTTTGSSGSASYNVASAADRNGYTWSTSDGGTTSRIDSPFYQRSSEPTPTNSDGKSSARTPD